ncbi:MAG: hypothetical protein JWM56_190 [Candidatus Peribacteria bacterium]|nr:hypothetical protein [Candidatus Peribacteria bacterium]
MSNSHHASEDWLILSDMHLGLHEMDKPLAQKATRNNLDLIQKIQPSNLVFNGDAFDAWVYPSDTLHPKSIQAAERQWGPYKDFLTTYQGKTSFISGNCDEGNTPDEFPMVFQDILYDKSLGLLITHGHRLGQLITQVRNKSGHLIHSQKVQNYSKPALAKNEFSVKKNATDDYKSAVSTFIKRCPSVQWAMQEIHMRLMNTLAREWAKTEQSPVRTAVFSHTHRSEIRTTNTGLTLANPGTAGPQDCAPEATVLVLRSGIQSEIWVTASKDSQGALRK